MSESAPEKNFLQAWRLHRRMTQEALAEAIGSSKATIGHLEGGERRLSDKWLRKLAPALKTTPGYLLDHHPDDLPTDILDIWQDVPAERREQAKEVLATFTKTGTGG